MKQSPTHNHAPPQTGIELSVIKNKKKAEAENLANLKQAMVEADEAEVHDSKKVRQ